MILGTAFSNSFCGIGLGIYAGALILDSIQHKRFEWTIFPERRLLLFLLASLLVSTLMSELPAVSVNGLGKYLQSFLILFAAMDILRCSGKQKLALMALAGAFVLAILAGLSQEWFGADILRGHRGIKYLGHLDILRLTGSFKHPNDYGAFLIAGFPLSLAGFVMAWKIRQKGSAAFWALLFLGLSYLMMRTMSRGAILSAFIAVFVFGMVFSFRWKVLAALAVGFVLMWSIPSPVQERFREMATFKGSSPERVVLMETSLRMVQDSPVFGLGLNTYSDQFPRYRPADYNAYMYAHNSYLQMATEAGWLGLGLYLLFLLTLIGRSGYAFLRHNTLEHTRVFGWALFAALAGLLVNCLFESCLQSTQLRTLFWALTGIACAMATYATSPKQNG